MISAQRYVTRNLTAFVFTVTRYSQVTSNVNKVKKRLGLLTPMGWKQETKWSHEIENKHLINRMKREGRCRRHRQVSDVKRGELSSPRSVDAAINTSLRR